MTREELKAIFPDATDEQITSMLNAHNKEVQAEKNKANTYKKDADKVAELQTKIKNLENANLTDAEKVAKEREESEQKIAELTNQINIMQTKSALAEQGIKGEDADKLIESSNGGKIDAELLGSIIKNREESLRKSIEKEMLDKTPNPDGGSGDKGKGEDKTLEFAKSIGKELGASVEGSKNILDNYI